MDIETKSRLSTIAVVALIGGFLSFIYTQVVYGGGDGVDAPVWMSFGIGFVIAGLVSLFEIWFVSNSDYPLRRLSFLPLLVVRVLINSALILGTIITFQVLADRYAGTQIISGQGIQDSNYLADYGFSVLISTVAIFYFQVRTFIGGQNLKNMIMGRYHKPSVEERIFIFCDVIGSTKAAVTLGDITFHEYLNELFVLFDKPITRNGGLVHSYVGDAVIATWPLGENKLQNSKALQAAAGIARTVENNKQAIKAKYGLEPGVRLAINGGKVVTGETGYSKKQITYLGDTVNTTARLEALCKDLDQTILASKKLMQRMEVPPGLAARDLGEHMLKGVDKPVGVVALSLQSNA